MYFIAFNWARLFPFFDQNDSTIIVIVEALKAERANAPFLLTHVLVLYLTIYNEISKEEVVTVETYCRQTVAPSLMALRKTARAADNMSRQ